MWKKINFKQLKYTIPLGIFPFLLFFGYNVIDLFTPEPEEQQLRHVETTEINTSLPEAHLDKKGIKSKYQSMLDSYGRVTDLTGVDNIEREARENKGSELKSAYTDRERFVLDSIESVREAEKKSFEREMERLRSMAMESQNQSGVAGESEARINVEDDRLEDNPMMSDLREQMMLAQKLANGERILTPEEEEKQQKEKEMAAYKAMLLDSIKRAAAPLEVNKTTGDYEQYFNSIKDRDERPGMIRAWVDEVLKVREGSRIRIRLSEDVEIGGEILPKGSYLYALVTGFGAQRVKATVSQVMVGGHIKRVDLSVYDLDCIEGFYVPNSAFRDLAKDIGSDAMNMNLDVGAGTEQNLQNIAMQSLQQAVQATTQAFSNHIRRNKAKIKFNTEVYLVNSKDIR